MFTLDQIEYLVANRTLKNWASKTLAMRSRIIEEKWGITVSTTTLGNIYQVHGIKNLKANTKTIGKS